MPGQFQNLHWRPGLILKAMGRVELGYVPWNVRICIGDEASDLPEFLLRVIVIRNNKCGDLNPDLQFLVEPDRIEDWLEPCTADLPVELIGEKGDNG